MDHLCCELILGGCDGEARAALLIEGWDDSSCRTAHWLSARDTARTTTALPPSPPPLLKIGHLNGYNYLLPRDNGSFERTSTPSSLLASCAEGKRRIRAPETGNWSHCGIERRCRQRARLSKSHDCLDASTLISILFSSHSTSAIRSNTKH